MPSFSYNNGKNTISNPFHFKISATNYISIISKNFWRFLVDSNDPNNIRRGGRAIQTL